MNSENRYSAVGLVGIFGVAGNVFLLVIMLFVGIMCQSQALIADAINSAGDIFASLMTCIGNKISSKPVDSTHNFGHGKAEYIFSMFISLSMIGVALKLIYDAVISFVANDIVFFSWYSIIVCAITILIKFLLYKYASVISKKHNSILVEANRRDHLNDMVVTTFTLFAMICNHLGIFWIDKIVACGIAVYILITGLSMFAQSSNVLMDKAVDTKTRTLLQDDIVKKEWVKRIDEFYSKPVGDKFYLVITVSVDGNMTTFESHRLADELEKELNLNETVYKTTVHINPV